MCLVGIHTFLLLLSRSLSAYHSLSFLFSVAFFCIEMVRISLAVLVLATAALGAPSPNYNAVAVYQEVNPVSCGQQSCALAALARSSTGKVPNKLPKGATKEGTACALQKLKLLQNEGRIPKNDTLYIPPSKRDEKAIGLNLLERVKRQLFGTKCFPYTLIFARGTTEMGALGITVGPVLTSGVGRKMPNQWKFTGVEKDYPADFLGNYCAGMPGGIAMMRYLEKEVEACPDTKIVLSGYSQGAMAVHNGIAYARPAARKQIIVSLQDAGIFFGTC